LFPNERGRRLRASAAVRDLVRETRLSPRDLVLPLFVDETIRSAREVPSMPGVRSWPVSKAADAAARAEDLGIRAVLLFGTPRHKDERGSGAWSETGAVQRATREIKASTGLAVITDLCLCEYTDHGHCGVLHGDAVDNDSTIELYGLTAISQAEAGADMVAPSGMMDGQVSLIREALDDAGFEDRGVMAYAAKHASAFYGPFRDAAHSAPSSGDRKGHQMDPANFHEAMRELRMDAEEGADILMIKPALPCLDIIREARARFDLPIAAYQVSGEYSMIQAAAARGWIDLDQSMMESLTAIKRAGAGIIVTYFAERAARAMGGGP